MPRGNFTRARAHRIWGGPAARQRRRGGATTLDALNGSEPAKKLLGQRLAQAEAQKWTWDALSGRTLLGKLLAKRGDPVGARRELALAKRLAEATSNKLVIDDCERALGELGRTARASQKPAAG